MQDTLLCFAGYVSWRSHVWTDVDPDRTGVLPFVWDKDFGFERYVEYALDVPMYFLYRSGKYEDATQQRCTFREYMAGKMPDRPGTSSSAAQCSRNLSRQCSHIRALLSLICGLVCKTPKGVLRLQCFTPSAVCAPLLAGSSPALVANTEQCARLVQDSSPA